MTAGLESLSDDGIGPARLEPASLVDRRGGRQNFRAPRSDPLQQVGGWKAEMKADDRRPELLEHIGRFCGERRAAGIWPGTVDVDSELIVVRPQQISPCGFARWIGRRRGVAEEVDIERFARAATERLELGAHV